MLEGSTGAGERLNTAASLLLIDAPGQSLAQAEIGFHYAHFEFAKLRERPGGD